MVFNAEVDRQKSKVEAHFFDVRIYLTVFFPTLIFLSLIQGLLQQVFYLPISAPEFITGPYLDLFQNIRVNAQYECFFFGHVNVRRRAPFVLKLNKQR